MITRIQQARLEGKVAIVTGGSRGIGRRICEVLAGAGANVQVVSSAALPNGQARSRAVADAINAGGGVASAFRCDVGSEADVELLVSQVLRRQGRIDIVVNNAAVRLTSMLLDTTTEEFERIFRVNVLGPFLLWKRAIPPMVERGAGNVVNIVSTNAPVQPFIGMAPYRMTKAALTYLSADLAHEVTDLGIAVNAFDPGPVVSDGTAAVRAERTERYGIDIPYHPQDPVSVVDEPILWLVEQSAANFSGHLVRRTEFGRTWGPAGA